MIIIISSSSSSKSVVIILIIITIIIIIIIVVIIISSSGSSILKCIIHISITPTQNEEREMPRDLSAPDEKGQRIRLSIGYWGAPVWANNKHTDNSNNYTNMTGWANLCHASQQQKLLSGPWLRTLKAYFPTCVFLQRSVFSQTPVGYWGAPVYYSTTLEQTYVSKQTHMNIYKSDQTKQM